MNGVLCLLLCNYMSLEKMGLLVAFLDILYIYSWSYCG